MSRRLAHLCSPSLAWVPPLFSRTRFFLPLSLRAVAVVPVSPSCFFSFLSRFVSHVRVYSLSLPPLARAQVGRKAQIQAGVAPIVRCVASATAPPTCTATGVGIMGISVAAKEAHFLVTARDRFGNARACGGDEVAVRMYAGWEVEVEVSRPIGSYQELSSHFYSPHILYTSVYITTRWPYGCTPAGRWRWR